MKALIIENEWTVDTSVQAFIKDNPQLFESVQEELYCLHRGKEELLPHILKNDAIVVASTWMYMDQLHEFLDGFLDPKFPKKMVFFVHWFTRKVNDWKHSWSSDDKEAFEKVKQLLKAGHRVYNFYDDPDPNSPDIFDGLDYLSSHSDKPHARSKQVYSRMMYSKEHDLFYDDYFDLEDQLEDEKRNMK